MTIADRILYTQILTRAGFTVRSITETHTARGSGVNVIGSFERWGTEYGAVLVKERGDTFEINGQPHRVVALDGGAFDLLVAHGDHPR